MTKPPSSASGRKPVPRRVKSSDRPRREQTARRAIPMAGRRIDRIERSRVEALERGRLVLVRRLHGLARAGAAAQRASSGISVSACTSEISTADASVIDSARKNWPTTPDSMPSGTKTTTVVSVEPTTGAISSRIASCDRLRRRLAAVQMAVDVLDDDDGIVDDEADGDGEAAHRHHVDRLAEPAHDEEGRHDGERQRDGGDEREAPVAQEDQQHDDGEHAADEDRVADVGDRGGDEFREVVGLGERETGRQRRAQIAAAPASTPARTSRMLAPICCEMLMLAATLPSPLMSAVRSGAPVCTVATSATRMVAPPLTTSGVRRDVVDGLPQARRQHKVLQTAGGITAGRLQLVRGLQRVGDVANRQVAAAEPRGIGDDLDLPRVARQHLDVADARHSRERRPHHIERVVVEIGRRQAARQVDADEGKRRRRQAVDRELEVSGQRRRESRRSRPCACCSATTMSVDGSNCAEISVAPRNVVDRTRRTPGTSISACSIGRVTVSIIVCAGGRAAVADDDDARKHERRIDVAGQREAGQHASHREHNRDRQDCAAVAIDERAEVHCSTLMAAPSGSPCWPRTMTESPAFRPLVTSASVGVVSPS